MTLPPYKGVSLLDQVVDALNSQVGTIQQQLNNAGLGTDVQSQVSALNAAVTGIADNVDGLTSNVNAVSGHVDTLQAQVDAIPSATAITSGLSNELDALSQQVASDRSDLDALVEQSNANTNAIETFQANQKKTLVPQGDWDASTNQYPVNPDEGDTYTVSAPGAPYKNYLLTLAGWQGSTVPLSYDARTNYFWPSTAGSRRSINQLASVTLTSGGIDDPLGGTTASRVVAAQDNVTGFGPYWSSTTQTDLPSGGTYKFKIALRAVGTPLNVTLKHESDAGSADTVLLTAQWQVYTVTALYNGTGSFTVYAADNALTGQGFDYAFVGAYDVDGIYIPTTTGPVTAPDYTVDASSHGTLSYNPAAGDTINYTAPADGVTTPTLLFTAAGSNNAFNIPTPFYQTNDVVYYANSMWNFLVDFKDVNDHLSTLDTDLATLSGEVAANTGVAAVSAKVDTISGHVDTLDSQVQDLESTKLDVGQGTYDYLSKNPTYYNGTAGLNCDTLTAGTKALVSSVNTNTPGTSNGFWLIETLSTFNGPLIQRAYGYTNGDIAVRAKDGNGSWSVWQLAASKAWVTGNYAALNSSPTFVAPTLTGNLNMANGAKIVVPGGAALLTGPAGNTWIAQRGISAAAYFILRDETGIDQWSWDSSSNLITTHNIVAGSITGTSFNVNGALTAAARVVINLTNTDTSSSSSVSMSFKSGSGAGGALGYNAPEYTIIPGWADSISMENMGAGGINFSAYGGGGFNFRAGTGRTVRAVLDSSGNFGVSGSVGAGKLNPTHTLDVGGIASVDSYVIVQSGGGTQMLLNHGGGGWGVIGNNSPGTWSLGYSNTGSTALDHSVFTWTNSGTATFNSSLTVNGNVISYSDDIPDAQDLNTYTIPGQYYQRLASQAASGTNYPEATAGLLEVIVGNTSTFIEQRYTCYSSDEFYRRGRYNGVWSSWRKVVSQSSAGAVTIDGSLTLGGSTLTMAGKSLTVDGSGNLAFNSSVFYNNAGFSLAANAHYWGFNSNGSMTMAGQLNMGALIGWSGYETPPTTGNPGWMGAGNGDSASFTANNMAIYSWNGIGFGPSITGQTIANGTYSHYFNVRTGDAGFAGNLTVNGIVAGTLSHTDGYLVIKPYNATYDDGSYVRGYYDGNSRVLKLLGITSTAGSFWTNVQMGALTTNGDVTVAGNVSITGTVSLSGSTTVGGSLTVSGTIIPNATTGLLSTWPQATGTIANGGGGGNYGVTLHANNNGGSSAASCAALTFIRDGIFGCFFGIDTDNQLKIGGWSMGNVSYRVVHEGLATVNLKDVSCTGVSFGSVVGSSATDLSKHIAMYGSTYGFSVTGNTINYVSGGGQHNFIDSTGAAGDITTGTLTATRIYSGYDSGVAYSISCSQWFRTTGNTGLYCSSWGGGVYMIDATYLRSYQNKAMMASDFVISSDITLKAGIMPMVYRGRLSPKDYVLKADGKKDIGFIAQEVKALYPEVVGQCKTSGLLQLSYSKLTAVLSCQLNLVEDAHLVTVKRVDKLELLMRLQARRQARNSRRIVLLQNENKRLRQQVSNHTTQIQELQDLVLSLVNRKPWWHRLWLKVIGK